jgi:hypothetical protein
VLRGRSVADAPDDPVVVEALREVAQCQVELPDGAEAPQPEELLLQGADEALDAAVALGLADEGGAGAAPVESLFRGTDLEGRSDAPAAPVPNPRRKEPRRCEPRGTRGRLASYWG